MASPKDSLSAGIREARRRGYHLRRRLTSTLRRQPGASPAAPTPAPVVATAVPTKKAAAPDPKPLGVTALTQLWVEDVDSGPATSEDVDSVPATSEDSLPDEEAPAPLDFHDRLVDLVEQATTPYVSFASTEHSLDLKVASQIISVLKESETSLASALITHRSDLGKKAAPGFAASHQRTQAVVEVLDLSEHFHDLDVHNKIFSRAFLLEVLRSCRLEPDTWSLVLSLTALCEAEFISIASGALVTREHPTESAEVRRHLASPEELRRRTQWVADGLDALDRLDLSSLEPAWRVFALDHVFGPLYPLAPRVDDSYWAELQAGVARLAKPLLSSDLRSLPIHTRILAHLTAVDERHDVEAVSIFRSDYGSPVAVASEGGSLSLRPHYLPRLHSTIPEDLLAAEVGDLDIRATLLRYGWDETGNLNIAGWAYIPGVAPGSGGPTTYLVVTALATGEVTTVPMEPYAEPRVDLTSNDRFVCYADSGFRATVAREVFLPPGGPEPGQDAAWTVSVRIDWQGHSLGAPIASRDTAGQAGFLWNDRLRDGARLVATFGQGEGLKLVLSQPRYLLEDLTLRDRDIEVKVATSTGLVADHLLINNKAAGLSTRAPLAQLNGQQAIYRASLPEIPVKSKAGAESEWTVNAVTSHFGTVALGCPGTDDSLSHLAGGRVWAETTGFGYLRLKERHSRILVTSVEVAADGEHLVVEGTCDFDSYHSLRIALVAGPTAVFAETTVTITSEGSSNAFSARIPLVTSRWGQEPTSLEAGGYSLRYLTPRGTLRNSHWILFDRRQTQHLPRALEFAGGTVEVTRTVNNAAVKIDIRPPLTEVERSLHGQHALQQEFFDTDAPAFADESLLRGHVLVQSYGGRKVTDAPLQLSQRLRRDYPDVPIYWGTVDCSTAIPEGTHRVIVGTREWFDLLASARVLINNNNFPHYFRKRPGQYYLQTWHGTPLKRLAFDADPSSFSLSYWSLMARESTYWDHLIAQNEFSEEVFATAFGYPGPFITQGYPRNDSLVDRDAGQRRQEARELLGIGADAKVVLYAPTWRDNVKSSRTQYAMVTYLDFEEFRKGLGSEWTILLRGHHNIAAGRQTKDLGVLDVTDYPEVNDLYLAADVLITDYSSVMFDFACTGKPILYLTPDIATYSESVRGFYFDFPAQAPGPLLATTGEVVTAIKRLDLVRIRHARRYAAFQRRFVARDDGRVTERVYAELPLARALEPR